MKRSGMNFAWMALLGMLVFAESGFAQHRVLTNDDVSSTPEPPAASDANAQTTPDAGAPKPSGTEAPEQASSRPDAKPDNQPGTAVPADTTGSTALAALNHLQDMQATFRSLVDQIAVVIDQTGDPALKEQWSKMRDSLSEVIRDSQSISEQIQSQPGAESDQGQQPAPASTSTPAQSPAAQ